MKNNNFRVKSDDFHSEMGHFLKGILTGTVATLAAIGSYRLLVENEKQESKT